MFKWMTRRMPPRGTLFRWTCLPEPERLLDLSTPATVDGERADEFSSIITSLWINDINKRTARDRLPETLRAIADALPENIRRVRFLDVGASDGVSTFDAVSYFRELRVPVTAHAIDLYTQLLRHDAGWLREYRTTEGSPVLLRAGRVGLRLGRRLAFPPAEWCRRLYLQSQWLRRRLRPAMSIPLVHPLAAADSDITVSEADALQHQSRFVDSFDVVRISNLLNLSYFSRADIERIVEHAITYLADGGVLAISKNLADAGPTAEQGSVWQHSQGRLTWIADFHGGFELRDWMTKFETDSRLLPRRSAA